MEYIIGGIIIAILSTILMNNADEADREIRADKMYLFKEPSEKEK